MVAFANRRATSCRSVSFLEGLRVHPNAGRRGVGTAAVAAVEAAAAADGAAALLTATIDANVGMTTILVRRGYTRVGQGVLWPSEEDLDAAATTVAAAAAPATDTLEGGGVDGGGGPGTIGHSLLSLLGIHPPPFPPNLCVEPVTDGTVAAAALAAIAARGGCGLLPLFYEADAFAATPGDAPPSLPAAHGLWVLTMGDGGAAAPAALLGLRTNEYVPRSGVRRVVGVAAADPAAAVAAVGWADAYCARMWPADPVYRVVVDSAAWTEVGGGVDGGERPVLGGARRGAFVLYRKTLDKAA